MKRTYDTKQRKQLIEFLDSHREYTIAQIVTQLTVEGGPAKSSIYRLMKQLVEEGVVKRYVKGNSREFVYELINGEGCIHHFHLKCMVCGKLEHLSEYVSGETWDAVFNEAGFNIDKEKTLMFGKCKECQVKEQVSYTEHSLR